MGKGGGSCVSSSAQAPAAAKQPTPVSPAQVQQQPPPAKAVQPTVSEMTTKVYIIFYSTWGHIYKMAQATKEGVDSVEGCEGILYQVPETLPEEVLQKMHAAPKPDVPVITVDDLPEADGFMFGIPTRYGVMAAQMKAFWDATGKLWQSGALIGKPAGVFVSTATQGGGQETTGFTAVTHFAHHGMVFVPGGYAYGLSGGGQFDNSEAHGGSAYGAGTLAGGDGARQPSKIELDHAKFNGTHIAKIVKKLKAAKD